MARSPRWNKTNPIPIGQQRARRWQPSEQAPLHAVPGTVRKFVDFAQVFQEWRERQVAIHLVSEGIDLSETNPMGKAMAAMMAVFAELEWDRSCERSKEAMAIRKKQGKAINGHAGYGFK